MPSQQSTQEPYKSKAFHLSLKRRLFSGVLILVPFTITLLVILWLYRQIRSIVRPLVAQLSEIVIRIPGLSDVPPIFLTTLVFTLTILILLGILYLIGSIGRWVLGKRLIALIEKPIKYVPLAGALYGASKQLVDAFGGTDTTAYKSVVLVEFPRQGCRALGFLTGFVKLNGNDHFAKVIIPTSPNPTTGFFQLFPKNEIQEVDMTVEEAFKMLLSFGLVAPKQISLSSNSPASAGEKISPSND